jgi:hypothetical protein
VQECGNNAVQAGNGIAAAANSTNQQKVSCMMECSVENVDCMVECQTDVTDTSCLPECTTELSECQKECNDHFPEINANTAGHAGTVSDPVQVHILVGDGKNAQTGNYNIYTTKTLSSNTNAKQGAGNSVGWVNPTGVAHTQSGSTSNTVALNASPSVNNAADAKSVGAASPKTEIVLNAGEGQIQTSSSKQTSVLKNLCLSSKAIERRSCLEECKIGVPEPGCTTECYQEYNENVAECNKEELERQQENAAVQQMNAPEIVIKTNGGQSQTSSTTQTSLLKKLCLSSKAIERRSCLEECKIGTPEVGCTTECYQEYNENVAECNKEELERQQENAAVQQVNAPEVVIKTNGGQSQTSSTTQTSLLKNLCLSSKAIERRSCLEECKIGTPEVGCTTECYQEYNENVAECNKEELERQQENAAVQQVNAPEVVIKTNGGQSQTSSTKQTSLLKTLCLSSSVIERKSCLEECKIGTQEPGCTTECYKEYNENVVECNEEEIERQQENGVIQQDSIPEVVIRTGDGQSQASTSKQTSLLKTLCLSSSVIERRSCLEECKIGVPEPGCSTECYKEYNENVVECNEEEIERQEENAKSETNIFSYKTFKRDEGEDYDYDSSSESNES